MSPQIQFSHILQKSGLLKNFSIAKVVPTKSIADLKKMIREKTSTEREYKKVLAEEMKRIGNMHDSDNPIPGILYEEYTSGPKIVKMVIGHGKKLKAENLTKNELCFYIMSLINAMGLTRKDFQNVNAKDLGIKDDKDAKLADDDEEEYDDGQGDDHDED